MSLWQYFDIHLCGCNHCWINISFVIIWFNASYVEGQSLATSLYSDLRFQFAKSGAHRDVPYAVKGKIMPLDHVWTGIGKLDQRGLVLSLWVTVTTSSLSFPFAFLLYSDGCPALQLLSSPKTAQGPSRRQQLNGHAWFIYFSADITESVLQIFGVLRADSPDSYLDDAFKIPPPPASLKW